MWKFPSLWDRGVDLQQHIDVAMHLIFLGVVKTCIQMVQEWRTMRGKHSAFLRYFQGVLEPIQRMGIDWRLCLPYKQGKLGGWVSENYLGAARLLTWLYSGIENVASDPQLEPPLWQQKDWMKVHNYGWLSIRGLDTK
jgi:hypothetical protein